MIDRATTAPIRAAAGWKATASVVAGRFVLFVGALGGAIPAEAGQVGPEDELIFKLNQSFAGGVIL